MKSAVCWLFLATAAFGQFPLEVLNRAITALQDPKISRPAAAQRITNEMMLLARTDRQPLRGLVLSFADEFANLLAGKEIGTNQVSGLTKSMADVIQGSGATFNAVTGFRQSLKVSGIPPERCNVVIRRLIAVGEEVRGPDDLPIQPFAPLSPRK